MKAPSPARYLTAAQLAERTGFTARYFRGLAQSGRIDWAFQPDGERGAWRFAEDGFKQWWKSGRISPPIGPAKSRTFTAEADRILRNIRMRDFTDDGVIYFIECSHWVKIGFSSSLEIRLEALQAGCPIAFYLLGTIPGSRSDEMHIHSVIREYRHRGEWFHLTPDLKAVIQELCHITLEAVAR